MLVASNTNWVLRWCGRGLGMRPVCMVLRSYKHTLIPAAKGGRPDLEPVQGEPGGMDASGQYSGALQ